MHASHTPGPWTQSLNGVYADIDTVAVAGSEANARLIAAAPDLLAALDLILGNATNDGGEAGEHELRERINAIAHHARAAIARATGAAS